jgi:hypothetical protein
LLKALAQPVAGTGYHRTGQTFGDHRVTFQTGCVPLNVPRSSRSSFRQRLSRAGAAAGNSIISISIHQHTAVTGPDGTGTCRMVPKAANSSSKRGRRAKTMHQQDVTVRLLQNSHLHHLSGIVVSSVVMALHQLLLLLLQWRRPSNRHLPAMGAAADCVSSGGCR